MPYREEVSQMRSLINITLIIIIIVLTLLVSGCRQQTEPVVPAPIPASEPTRVTTIPSIPKTTSKVEWILHKQPEEGYEITLPGTWKLVTEEKTQPGAGAKLLFYAVDPVSSTSVLDVDGSFSIMKAELPQEVSVSAFTDREVRGLEAAPTTVKPVTTKYVELLSGEALECTYTKNYPHRTGLVVFVQYALVRGKELYMLTSETTPSLFDKYRPIFEKMAYSFRLFTEPAPTLTTNPALTKPSSIAEKHFNQGLTYLDEDKYDEAIIEFTNSLKLDPYSTVTYTNRGIAYRQKGMSDQAIADFKSAIELDPNQAKAYCNRGLTYDDKGEYDRATADFSKAIELNPDYIIAYFNRGITHNNKGEKDRAISDFDKVIELAPNYTSAYLNRGNIYINKREYDRAITDYNKVIELKPNTVKAYYNRGSAYLDLGEYDRAIADFNKVIGLNPNLSVAYNNRGMTYGKKGEYNKAIADYTKAIDLDSNNVKAYRNRGFSYVQQGEYDKAIADYTKAIELTPNDAKSYYNRGYAYSMKNVYDKAIIDFKQCIELSDNPSITKCAEDNLKKLKEVPHE